MKKFIGILLAATMCFSLAACTNPFQEETEDTTGKVTIEVGVLGSTTEQEIFRKYKNGFQEKYPDVVVQLDAIPGDYATGMNNYVQNSTFPDVVFAPGDQHAAYSSRGHFADLRAYDEADDTFSFDDIYPELIETTHYDSTDEGIWFMPRDYNKVVTFVNKTMLSYVPGENGQMYAGYGSFEALKEAWSLETFYEVCAAVKAKVDANAANPSAVPQEEKLAGLIKNTYAVDARYNWYPAYEPILRHYGGSMIDLSKTGTGEKPDYENMLSVDSDDTMKAYRSFYENLAKTGYVKQSLSSTGVAAFPNSQAAFWFTTRPSWGDINAVNATFEVDFLPFPYDYVGVGCTGYAITKAAEERVSEYAAVKDGTNEKMTNADYGWLFLKYIVSADGQNAIGETGMGVPSLMSMKDSGTWLEYGSSDLNHEAFVQSVEGQTVMAVNDIYSFPATAQKTISDNCLAIMTYVVKDQFWPADLTLELNRTNYERIYGKVDEYKNIMMTRINAAN